MHGMHTKPHLSPIMRVRAGTMPGCLRATISNMNLLGLPSTTGCRPAAVATAATMEPVPVKQEAGQRTSSDLFNLGG